MLQYKCIIILDVRFYIVVLLAIEVKFLPSLNVNKYLEHTCTAV